MSTHIVQSPEWGEFKTSYGTPSVRVGNVQYTKHKIPFSNYYYAYCPRVNPFELDFDSLRKSAQENNCINVNFDVPNIIQGSEEQSIAESLFKEHCVRAPRNQFAKGNVILDITPSEEELLNNMHKKHKYNINYAIKKGVVVESSENPTKAPELFDTFYKLYQETFDRQKYYGRSRTYLKDLWEIFYPKGLAHVLVTKYESEPLAAWMLMPYDGVLYYPYGGSSEKYKNLFGSNLVAWESIKLGKKLGCRSFDMWGTAVDPNDTSDSYYGFTNFKLKFGGKHVIYIDSYDMVINESVYKMFNTANNLRWKLLTILR